jgi:hypothetical protein
MSDGKPRWAKVPGAFIERAGDLSFRAWRMYAALALYANRSGQAWPSQSTLRRLLGWDQWSRRNVRDAIDELRLAGWIKREPSTRDDGGWGSNTYLLEPQPWPNGAAAAGSSATPLAAAPYERGQGDGRDREASPPDPWPQANGDPATEQTTVNRPGEHLVENNALLGTRPLRGASPVRKR